MVCEGVRVVRDVSVVWAERRRGRERCDWQYEGEGLSGELRRVYMREKYNATWYEFQKILCIKLIR